MNKLYKFIIIAFSILINIYACDGNQNDSFKSNIKDCTRSGLLGDKEICLPKMEALIECYDNLNVRKVIDKLNYNQNKIFGYYIGEKDFQNLNTPYQTFNETISLYYYSQYGDKKATPFDLEQIKKLIEKNFLYKNWKEIKSRAETEINLKFDKPVLIDKVNGDNIVSLILLQKVNNKNYSKVGLNIISIMILKDRLLFVAYNYPFEDQNSIIEAKAKNEYFIQRLKLENN
jgi:hypothetical protein